MKGQKENVRQLFNNIPETEFQACFEKRELDLSQYIDTQEENFEGNTSLQSRVPDIC